MILNDKLRIEDFCVCSMKIILVTFLVVIFNFGCTPGKSEKEIQAEKAYALVQHHCFRCHNPEKKKGKVDLESFASAKAPLKNIKLWRHALNMAEERTMPPDGKKQPTEQERQDIIAWLQGSLEDSYALMPDDPGKTVVRRLNRTEYENTLNELLHIDEAHGADIPLESVGYGFDNIAELLNVPPLLMEKYLATARAAVDKAIWDDPSPKMDMRIGSDEFVKVGGAGHIQAQSAGLYSNGSIRTDFNIQLEGKYKLRINAYGTQAGNEPVKAEIKLDGKLLKIIDIKNEEYSPGNFDLEVNLAKGKRTLDIAFINDYYDGAKKKDRNFFLKWVSLNGPMGQIKLPLSHTALVKLSLEDKNSEEMNAIKNIKDFLERAYRSKVSDEQLSRYVNLYSKVRKGGRSPYQSLKTAYMAALVSPNFLFRLESKPEKISPVNDYELAVRLSYFLTSTMPDDQLLALASKNLLSQPAVYKQEIERLLSSKKLMNFSENFSGQWLMLRSLDRLHPDMKKFPEWNEDLKDSMKNEAVTLFHSILAKNESIKKFIHNDEIFVNETLAKHYGIPNISGANFRAVKAPESRGGILTMSSTLAVTSMPARTSPVKRGKWILDEILGTPPPEPPADVSPLEETEKVNPNLSLRKKLELHRADEGCASCHRIMDSFGFCLENFNPLGKWRDTEDGKPIETGGELPDGTKLTDLKSLQQYIISKEDKFAEHLITKLLIYATGRGTEESDYKTIAAIVAKTKDSGYRFQDIIIEICNSVPFRMKRP